VALIQASPLSPRARRRFRSIRSREIIKRPGIRYTGGIRPGATGLREAPRTELRTAPFGEGQYTAEEARTRRYTGLVRLGASRAPGLTSRGPRRNQRPDRAPVRSLEFRVEPPQGQRCWCGMAV
jgi:hypothetical protein